jgi:hypothetical protein
MKTEVARAEYVTAKIMEYDPKCSTTFVTLGSIFSIILFHSSITKCAQQPMS